jgi:hypothetical protein
MKTVILWSAILFFFAVSCLAQKNEVDMVLGNTWSFNSNTSVAIPGLGGPLTFPSGRNSTLTYEAGVARQLVSFRPGSLSLELNAAGFPASLNGNPAAVFVIPGAKFNFLPSSRVSPFVGAGVGFVHLSRGGSPSTNAAAYQFGGGADVKTWTRYLNLRAEVRDFLAADSGFANIATSFPGVAAHGSSRNHLLVGGGAVLRF